MPYTKDGIMAQIWVAFGQGTGCIRVSQEAAWQLHELYYDAITSTVINSWGTEGTQVLERIRAIGRLAASKATEDADPAITAAQVETSAYLVEQKSDTALCPPRP
jgi:hypothetical protein